VILFFVENLIDVDYNKSQGGKIMQKYMKVVISVMMLTLLSCIVLSSNSDAASLNLVSSAQTLQIGESITLKIGSVKSSKVKWASSKTSVATVSKTGVVKAKKAGTTTITATYNKINFKCKITVVAKAKKVTLYNSKDFKIVFTGIKRNGLSLQIQNKTDKDYKISVEYLICDNEYYNEGVFYGETIPNNFQRTILLESVKKLDTSAKNISVRLGIWEADTGYIEKYITVKKVKIR
jgi:hypothetical protein